jgi:hypothetical protein
MSETLGERPVRQAPHALPENVLRRPYAPAKTGDRWCEFCHRRMDVSELRREERFLQR